MKGYEMNMTSSSHGARIVPKASRISRRLRRFLTSSTFPGILVILTFAVCLSTPSTVHGQIARFDEKTLTWEGTGVRPANGHSSAAVKYTATGLLPLASSDDTSTNYNVDNSPVAIWKEICNVKIALADGGSETAYVTMTINDTTDVGAQLILTSLGERWQLSPPLRASIETSGTEDQTASFPLSNVVITGKVVRQSAEGSATTFALSPEASIIRSGKDTYKVLVRGPAADMQYAVSPGNGMPNGGNIAIWRPPSKTGAPPGQDVPQKSSGAAPLDPSTADDYLIIFLYMMNDQPGSWKSLVAPVFSRHSNLEGARTTREWSAGPAAGFEMILTSDGMAVKFGKEWVDPLSRLLVSDRGRLAGISFRNGSASVRTRYGDYALQIADGTEAQVGGQTYRFNAGAWQAGK